MDYKKLGSETAKGGFRNEDDVMSKFNNWKEEPIGKEWLIIMGYNLKEIEYVKAIKIHGYKTDIQVQVTIKLISAIDCQNLQVKLVSNKKGFNQIDKRWVDKYKELWNIPDNIIATLKLYTGETKPSFNNSKDKRRMYLNEFDEKEREQLILWLNKNKTLIISDILKGRGQFAAEWMLVYRKFLADSDWVLKPINFVLNYFGNGEIVITKSGNIKIGKIGMQRKGGDGGRETANMLQFKIDPAELFDIK